MRRDIDSASYAELSAWIMDIGKDPQGNIEALRAVLYQYYEISDDPSTIEQSSDKTEAEIEIISADLLTRINLDDDQDILTLSGGVSVIFSERGNESLHTIHAYKITLNQNEDLLTAEGNVEYRLTGSGNSEIFHGESLQFHIDDWSGFFVSGETTQENSEDSDKPNFTFSGDVIQRSSNDVIRLSNGNVTSSQWDPPAYSIRAKEIMVYAPGEWSITQGALYVGNIPVFWLPAFFHSGEDILFHPSFGFDSERGGYVYTSTYLLGQKEKTDPSFSFLSFADVDDKLYRTRVEGLFLRKTTEELDNDFKKGSSAILLTDYSTLLGFHLGFLGEFNPNASTNKVNLYFGLGVTKNRYPSSLGLTSLYRENNLEDFSIHWNSARIYNITLPFRFGLHLKTTLNPKPFSISLQIPFYSDRRYLLDFSNRSQDIQWSELLGLSSESETTASDTHGIGLGLGSSLLSNFTWRASISGRIPTPVFDPIIQSISITDLSSEMRWQSYPIDPNALGKETTDSSLTSDNQMFLIQQFSPLSLSISIQGSLLPQESNGTTTTEIPDANLEQETMFLFPDVDTANDSAGEEQNEEEVTINEGTEHSLILSDLLTIKDTGFVSENNNESSLTYTTSGSINYFAPFQNSDPINPENILLEPKYWQVNQRTRLGVNGSYSMNKRLEITLNTELNVVQNELLKWFDEEIERSSDLLTIFRPNKITLTQTASASFQIFPTNSALRDWKISYTISPTYYQRSFVEISQSDEPIYEELSIDWTPDSVTKHLVSLTLGYKSDAFTLSNVIAYNLPPLDEKLDVSSSMKLWNFFALTANTEFKLTEEQPLSPFTFNASLGDTKNYKVSQKMIYNPVDNQVTSLSTSIKIFMFSADLYTDYQQPYVFTQEKGWRREGDEQLLVSRFSIQATDTIIFKPFWKNRINSSFTYNLRWNQGVMRFTDSTFTSDFGLTFSIYKFLDLKFSIGSVNNAMYLYFPGFINRVESELPGIRSVSLLEDLLKGLNIFNPSHLQESAFNLNKLSFSLVHDLGDWILNADLALSPKLNDDKTAYIWSSLMTIGIKWKAISEVTRTIKVENTDSIILE